MQVQKVNNQQSFGIRNIKISDSVAYLGQRALNVLRESKSDIYKIGDDKTDIIFKATARDGGVNIQKNGEKFYQWIEVNEPMDSKTLELAAICEKDFKFHRKGFIGKLGFLKKRTIESNIFFIININAIDKKNILELVESNVENFLNELETRFKGGDYKLKNLKYQIRKFNKDK